MSNKKRRGEKYVTCCERNLRAATSAMVQPPTNITITTFRQLQLMSNKLLCSPWRLLDSLVAIPVPPAECPQSSDQGAGQGRLSCSSSPACPTAGPTSPSESDSETNAGESQGSPTRERRQSVHRQYLQDIAHPRCQELKTTSFSASCKLVSCLCSARRGLK